MVSPQNHTQSPYSSQSPGCRAGVPLGADYRPLPPCDSARWPHVLSAAAHHVGDRRQTLQVECRTKHQSMPHTEVQAISNGYENNTNRHITKP